MTYMFVIAVYYAVNITNFKSIMLYAINCKY